MDRRRTMPNDEPRTSLSVRPRRLRRPPCAALLATALIAATSLAAAEDQGGKRLYERAAAAEKGGDYAEAARLFAEADTRGDDRALARALSAAILADAAGLGMDLAARAESRQSGGEAAQLAGEARERFADRAGQLEVVCDDCSAVRVDGNEVKAGARSWVTADFHLVEFDKGGDRVPRLVKVESGKGVRISPDEKRAFSIEKPKAPKPPKAAAPAPAEPSEPAAPAPPLVEPAAEEADSGGGISPAWFWTGLGLTAAATGATIASGIDTLNRHKVFVATQSPEIASSGKAADVRTQVLIGVSAALAVGTAAVGIFAVDWGGSKTEVVGGVGVAPGGAMASVRGAF